MLRESLTGQLDDVPKSLIFVMKASPICSSARPASEIQSAGCADLPTSPLYESAAFSRTSADSWNLVHHTKTRRLVDTKDAQVQHAPRFTNRRAEDAAGVAALIGIPVHLSGKQGHDYNFEIEN